ncbi:hypothetical protein EVAR_53286_1 [Eumeta japonica]|uniref:Uncharacterized protein n=1 Tax=Eumeta variegata TaxID=151549 RepID=A0A4C1Z1H3_EUMVA|nr:hypothetical protein EVAR_53286_1 [Eumeta japonica]
MSSSANTLHVKNQDRADSSILARYDDATDSAVHRRQFTTNEWTSPATLTISGRAVATERSEASLAHRNVWDSILGTGEFDRRVFNSRRLKPLAPRLGVGAR